MKLVISEKPSVGKSISAVLGATERGDGFFSGSGWIVSWCLGHLVELAQAAAYNERYKTWRREDLPILPEQWKYTARPDTQKQLAVLHCLMADPQVDAVVCATDAGREGQLIFQLVYDYCGCTKPVQRLWISSMEESAIRAGFANLQPNSDYENLYRAALCRSQADWLVGINASRLFSTLYRTSLNVGRVQTPTLALIAAREQAISDFAKEPFYIPELDCSGFTAAGERHTDRQEADSIRAACDGQQATAQAVERREKHTAPPQLYDLTTLQREANRVFGYTAQQTLDYTQALYEKKLCTYPRTDSRFLTSDMAGGLPGLASAVAGTLPLAAGLELPCHAEQVVDDSRVTDHHAIVPTNTMPRADLAALPSGELNVLHMIAVRLLCAVGDAHDYAETEVTVICAGHTFRAKGRTVLHEGWKALDGAFLARHKGEADGKSEAVTLPDVAEGQTFASVAATVREGFTSPPKHYTEDLVLAAMASAGKEDFDEVASCGLGTPATRAATIEKLIKSGLMERRKRHLVPTDKGRQLLSVLPEAVQSPALTAEWENQLRQVERGELDAAQFMAGISDMVQALVADHPAPDEQHLAQFAQQRRGKPLGSCPRCGGGVYENKKGFCCERRSCGFALWKDSKFFTAKKKSLTKSVAAALIQSGRVSLSGLYSARTGKTYDATVVLEDTGKYVNYKLDFDTKRQQGPQEKPRKG